MGGLEGVLRSIRPDRQSEARERAFVARALARLKKEFPQAKVVLAGSFAKGTFLEGDKDIDIFVLFKHSMEKEAMEAIVRAGAENAFPGAFLQIAYAQHPYVRVFLEGRKIDVVPAYELGHGLHFQLRSAVDRSQLHTDYILKRMSGAQKDEVRLLKKFLKVAGLYGAEIKVQGFSGYLCELLVLKYGTFAGALSAAAQWKERTFIDVEHKAKESEQLAKFETPLVVLDPVDSGRNVSAVVSPENYSALIALARKFISSKNTAQFFSRKTLGAAQLAKLARGRHIHCMEFASPKVVDDVLWGQVRRFYASLSAEMKKEGFEIIGHAMGARDSRICILLELLNEPLPEFKLVQGPPLQFEKDCAKFAKQYAGSFIYCGRLAARVKRETRTFQETAKKTRRMPLPSHLSSAKHAKLYKGAKAIARWREVLENYFLRSL